MFMYLNSFLHSPNTCWLIGTGRSITDTSKNWYEQISSLWPAESIFPFHCILHAFDLCLFAASLKQRKTSFYNLSNIFVALQNVVTCQFNFEHILLEIYSSKDTNGKLHLFEYQLM